jgi:hypothetical protein
MRRMLVAFAVLPMMVVVAPGAGARDGGRRVVSQGGSVSVERPGFDSSRPPGPVTVNTIISPSVCRTAVALHCDTIEVGAEGVDGFAELSVTLHATEADYLALFLWDSNTPMTSVPLSSDYSSSQTKHVDVDVADGETLWVTVVNWGPKRISGPYSLVLDLQV